MLKMILAGLSAILAIILKFWEGADKRAKNRWQKWRNGYAIRKARRVERATAHADATKRLHEAKSTKLKGRKNRNTKSRRKRRK
jgi:hypothetical protein